MGHIIKMFISPKEPSVRSGTGNFVCALTDCPLFLYGVSTSGFYTHCFVLFFFFTVETAVDPPVLSPVNIFLRLKTSHFWHV